MLGGGSLQGREHLGFDYEVVGSVACKLVFSAGFGNFLMLYAQGDMQVGVLGGGGGEALGSPPPKI